MYKQLGHNTFRETKTAATNFTITYPNYLWVITGTMMDNSLTYYYTQLYYLTTSLHVHTGYSYLQMIASYRVFFVKSVTYIRPSTEYLNSIKNVTTCTGSMILHTKNSNWI